MTRRSSRLLRPATVAALLIAATPLTSAIACRCPVRGPTAQARGADAVVTATVERHLPGDAAFTGYRIVVTRSWKAPLHGRIDIRTDRTDCRSLLTDGRAYLLYLERTPKGYVTSLCSGNLPVDRAGAAIAVLNRLYR